MSYDADVGIVGGGPAGTAAAITAAGSGMRVRLYERASFPRNLPGETLHPGVGVLLAALGVDVRVTAASAYRHAGVFVDWGGNRSVQPFGQDEQGPWLGYQILRRDLDRILMDRALELGVDIRQPVGPVRVRVEDGRVVGLREPAGETRYRFLIDASGRAGFLRRGLALPSQVASPPLRVAYGYRAGDPDALRETPTLVGDASGWAWMAQVAPGLVHWTRLAFDGSKVEGPPRALADLPPIGPTKGADVSWNRVVAAAGAGYFIAGDAAMVLDPVASNGTLRALLSGMRAARSIEAVRVGAVPEARATGNYDRWLADWFDHNVRQLDSLYRELRPVHSPYFHQGESLA
ncbi:MAG: Dehydrogenase (flavoprotein) [Candidatus Nitrotoga sp. SPKER]|nr:MAG: Dehydrogenase (flavoprotein) [Candidatus Nitrotoga sp. SPKER]